MTVSQPPARSIPGQQPLEVIELHARPLDLAQPTAQLLQHAPGALAHGAALVALDAHPRCLVSGAAAGVPAKGIVPCAVRVGARLTRPVGIIAARPALGLFRAVALALLLHLLRHALHAPPEAFQRLALAVDGAAFLTLAKLALGVAHRLFSL